MSDSENPSENFNHAQRIKDILDTLSRIKGYKEAHKYDCYASMASIFTILLSQIPAGPKRSLLMHKVADCLILLKSSLELEEATCTVIYNAVFEDMIDVAEFIRKNPNIPPSPLS